MHPFPAGTRWYGTKTSDLVRIIILSLRALLVGMWKQGDDFLNSCPVFVDFSSLLVTIILADAPFPAGYVGMG